MQNISWRQPGSWRHWYVNQLGVITSDSTVQSSQGVVIRTQSGYTGTFPNQRPLPNHAYDFSAQQLTLSHDASYHYTNGTHEYALGAGLNTSISGATFLPAFDWTALENQAIDRLSTQVRGDLDVSIDLAEAGKTLKMLRLSDQIVDFTKTFVRRFGVLGVASKAWLTYTYGIRPTIQTLFGVADENIRIVINKTAKYRARASGLYQPTLCNLNSVVGSVNFPVVLGSPMKVSVTYGVDLRTDQFDLARWSTLNPVGIAWELLPFSFVVDWFYDVGSYLRNMETYCLYANKFRSGYKTRLSASNMKVALVDVGVSPGEISHSSKWLGTVRHVSISRSVLSSYPAPRLPVFEVDLGSSRLLSAASLLAQLLGRR